MGLVIGLVLGLVAGCVPGAGPGPSATPTTTGADPTAGAAPTPSGGQLLRGARVAVRDATVPPPAPRAVPAPVRLDVPTVDVAMPVDPVGVTDDGAMALPPDAGRAGWFRFGPAPGSAAGTTVIAAHVDSRRSGVGPFAQLRRLRAGDAVEVVTDDGAKHAYVVTDVVKVPKDEAPLDAWFDRDGDPRLVLLTCGGAWRADIGHYADNVVVTAEPVGG